MESSGKNNHQQLDLGLQMALKFKENGTKLRKCTKCEELIKEKDWVAGHDCIENFKKIVAKMREEINELK